MGTRNELRGFLKQSQSNEVGVRTRGSSRSRKECVNDELVKYMSKLPSYLQRVEGKEESVQSNNVLNVGVLDWGRLEKWKHGERLRKVSNEDYRCKIDVDELHICSNLGKGKGSRDLERSVCGVRCTLEPELASRGLLSKQEVATCGRDHKGVKSRKSRRSPSYRESDSCLVLEMGNSAGLMGEKETKKRVDARERATESCERLDEEKKIVLKSEPLEHVNARVGWESKDMLSLDLERDSEDMMVPLGVGRRGHLKTASRVFDQDLQEEDESRKNRQHSPSKRFSVSFGRLSKSFSSKEDSAGQLFSSSDDTIKSDSTRFDGSSSQEKQNVQCGSRISPLRRLLDNVLPPKPTNRDVPCQEEKKQDTSRRTRALFQLTVRNGIPLFQFMVDDDNISSSSSSSSRIILGGTMKSSAFCKDDSVQYCTFYSVNEVKKKKSGSWLIHGHKEKQLGFVYNVIGQMEMSNTLSLDITEQKPRKNRESVLFEESEEVKGRKEVAAVVIKKKPVEEYFPGLEETTVIIPGGVHSFPEKGAPSPLISRWRTGGVCDCGGWDVGCTLHVLSNKTFLHEFDKSFKLFDQEGSEKESGSVLEMREVKTGMYRVEFGSFLSALQAFFVCVTVIACGNEEDRVAKTTGKSSSPFVPPLSPVGRV